MDETAIRELRSKILGDDSRARAESIRTAIRHPSDTAALIPDFYDLYRKGLICVSSESRAAICRYGKWAAPFLLQLLDSADDTDRQNAIHLLLGLRHHRSSYRIYGQILDDRPDSQPEWGSQRDLVILKLYGALNDVDLDVRTIAAATLDDISETPDSIVDLLIDGLNSKEIYLQNIAALHLGRLGSVASTALTALNEFVESNTDPVDGTERPVLAATNAIQRINGT